MTLSVAHSEDDIAGMQIAPVVLEGRNVRLEPYSPAHFEELAALALSAPETFRFIPIRMQTREDLVARFALAERLMASGGGLSFVTRLSATGEAVGIRCTSAFSTRSGRT